MTAAPPAGATPVLARGSRPLATAPDRDDGAGQLERPPAHLPARRPRSLRWKPARSLRGLVRPTVRKVVSSAIAMYALGHLDALTDFLRELIGATQ